MLPGCGSESGDSATRADGSCRNLDFAEGQLENIIPLRPTGCRQAGEILKEWSERYFTRDTIYDDSKNGWFCSLDSIVGRNGYKASCISGLNGSIKLVVNYEAS